MEKILLNQIAWKANEEVKSIFLHCVVSNGSGCLKGVLSNFKSRDRKFRPYFIVIFHITLTRLNSAHLSEIRDNAEHFSELCLHSILFHPFRRIITLRISVFFDTFSRRWTNSYEFKSNKWNRSVKNNSKRSLDTINNTIHEDTRKINNVEMIICLLLNWSYRFWYILLIFLLGYYNSCALNDSNIVNFKRTWNIIRYQLLPDRSVIVN